MYSVGSLLQLNGEPIDLTKNTKVINGSPFFKDDWQKADIIIDSKHMIPDVMVKLDMVTNEVHYLLPDKTENITAQPLQRIFFKDAAGNFEAVFVIGRLLNPTDKKLENAWLQEISTGGENSYKYISKYIVELKSYGSAAKEYTIETSEKTYVIKDNLLVRRKN